MGEGSEEKTTKTQVRVQNGVKRMIAAVVCVIVEVTVFLLIINALSGAVKAIYFAILVLDVLLVLAIYSQDKTAAMKMPWIVLILAVPILGVSLYLIIGLNGSTRKMKKRYAEMAERLSPMLVSDGKNVEELAESDPETAGIARYVERYMGFPLYKNTELTYYSDTNEALRALKKALRDAKRFIFMEYYAIEDAVIWKGILEILERKAAEGVEIRIFYDDMGSIGFINTDFVRRMQAKGFACRVFNPFSLGLNFFLNNRDHRKITVIDGQTGFTGGFNLADEYFGLKEPFGKWKDAGVRLEGEAVRSLTVAFLEMWNAVRAKDADDTSFAAYLSSSDYKRTPAFAPEGYVQPYTDGPVSKERGGENIYMSAVESARDYIWFTTPYLVLTDEMIRAMTLAAKRGVDVRIVTPGIPDKKVIYSITRSYYNSLAKCGVRIYEYTPGFVHAKLCVTDDRMAVCGTVNLDYRSLYQNFEDGCVFSHCRAVGEVKKDIEALIADSAEVTEQYASGRSAGLRTGQLFLRLFAPLF